MHAIGRAQDLRDPYHDYMVIKSGVITRVLQGEDGRLNSSRLCRCRPVRRIYAAPPTLFSFRPARTATNVVQGRTTIFKGDKSLKMKQ